MAGCCRPCKLHKILANASATLERSIPWGKCGGMRKREGVGEVWVSVGVGMKGRGGREKVGVEGVREGDRGVVGKRG